MALLDVSEVISDPLFTSPVELIASKESFDENGNPRWDDGERSVVMAVVTSDMKSIQRLPDSLRREGTILVRCLIENLPQEFQGKGYDTVIWRGRRFTINDTADYSQFGSGFIRMVCSPEEASDGRY